MALGLEFLSCLATGVQTSHLQSTLTRIRTANPGFLLRDAGGESHVCCGRIPAFFPALWHSSARLEGKAYVLTNELLAALNISPPTGENETADQTGLDRSF